MKPKLKWSRVFFIKMFCVLWLLERPDQKDQFSSEKEKVTQLNRKNAEKTSTSELQRSCAVGHKERQDKADFVLRNSTELRENAGGKDGPCIGSLERQESNILGDKQYTVHKGGKSGFPSKEDIRGIKAEHRVSTAASETVLDKHPTANQHIDEMNGGPTHER